MGLSTLCFDYYFVPPRFFVRKVGGDATARYLYRLSSVCRGVGRSTKERHGSAQTGAR